MEMKEREKLNNRNKKIIQIHFNNLNNTFYKLKNIQNDISLAYKYLGKIISLS